MSIKKRPYLRLLIGCFSLFIVLTSTCGLMYNLEQQGTEHGVSIPNIIITSVLIMVGANGMHYAFTKMKQ